MQRIPNESDTELAVYWAKAATVSGKVGLKTRARLKRSTWAFVIGATITLKRIFDILISGFALVALSPIFCVTAALVKLEDKGPVFFTQQRIGLKGQSFMIWKFRSMVLDAEKVAQRMIEQQEAEDTIEIKLKGDSIRSMNCPSSGTCFLAICRSWDLVQLSQQRSQATLWKHANAFWQNRV